MRVPVTVVTLETEPVKFIAMKTITSMLYEASIPTPSIIGYIEANKEKLAEEFTEYLEFPIAEVRYNIERRALTLIPIPKREVGQTIEIEGGIDEKEEWR